ncbi:C1 family peptidase [Candidatus Methylospira mobilis]|uniref:C1 family peptidase n=1 Tax=Candidatus Methylospira mobilis TaxID=1808979 RepID=A0A5Q0BII7_9GAMM|nr:C1 family peptidase [Candidatus Methylospira mobilis]QFY41977.1 C1 family peptidase [Candidatus Methylospira mobilis]WNV02966.1 C1 family peptidase [Candidatus Methylospira mobilis]
MNKLKIVAYTLSLLLPAILLGGQAVPPPDPVELIPAAPAEMYRNNLPPVLEKHATGYIPENPEKYLVMPQVPHYRDISPPESVLAPEADLSAMFPKPGNQGKQNSCVAWATAYTRSYHEARKQGGSKPSDPEHIFSPAFIYNQVKVGGCDSGSSISESLGLMKKAGVATEAVFPYEENNCSRLPDDRALTDASHFRIDGWKKLDTQEIDDIKGQIIAGNPVIFGMYVSDSFDRLRGDQVYDDLTSPRTGAHVVVLVGYSETRQAFKLLNSWGENWGDKGMGWISYGALKKWAENAFVIELASTQPH